MRRRVFLIRGLLLPPTVATLVSILQSCAVVIDGEKEETGAGDKPRPTRATCAAEGNASFSFLHTHPVECVTVKQVKEGVEISLNLTGSIPHEVVLSVAQLNKFASGESVTVESTPNFFHTHNVTFQGSNVSGESLK